MKDTLTQFKKDIEKEKIIGTEKVLKEMKRETLEKVYISLNAPQAVKEEIKRYGKQFNIEVVQLQYPNDELGHLTKKPYHISVLGILKTKQ